MRGADQQEANRRNHRLILKRVFALRCIALVSAIVIATVFDKALQKAIFSQEMLITFLCGIAFVAATGLRLQRKSPVSATELFIHLIFDALLLITLITFSGGATNPFIYYYLVLIAVASSVLSLHAAWSYCAAAVLAYSLLMFNDLNGHAHHQFSDFQLHLLGMWFNFVGSAILMCLFISRFSTALRDREAMLAGMRETNLKNEQLVGIATLATSTAHNLGTPLNSVAILLSDFDYDTNKAEMSESIELALSQIIRAKSTLKQLSALAEPKATQTKETAIAEISEQIKEHYLLSNPRVMPSFAINKEIDKQTTGFDIFSLHAIINLIDNAIRATRNTVNIEFASANQQLHIHIDDNGDGFSSEQLENWGQPLADSEGLGIGIFLANHTIEKQGGRVLAKRHADMFTRVTIELPMKADSNDT